MDDELKQRRIERLTERLNTIDERLTEEQSKETPNTNKVNNLNERKNKVQNRIDDLSE